MKLKLFASLVLATLALASCDNTTDTLGFTITDIADNLTISTDTFTVTTRSIKADSVISRNTTAYLGKIRDPETGSYITGDCMVQFNTFENYSFPTKDSIRSLVNGQVIADSVEIRLYYDDFYGDSLQTMKLRAYEMNKPMDEGVNYYSNFSPLKEGYVRSNGLTMDKVYSLTDLNMDKDTRYSSSYRKNIRINLDKEYKGEDGVTYNNFGTYLMRKYYEHPEYYKNSYSFIHNLVPGFFFKNVSGLGSMAYVSLSQLNVYFRYTYNDSIYTGIASFPGTEEVLQTTTITNDNTINQLAADNTCTYLKAPAGIFTEMTLPIDNIIAGHENDSINTAKVTLTRINNTTTSDYALDVPQTLLMIPKAQLYSFFENRKLPDYKSSFLTTFTTSTNTYTFSNISGMINYMKNHRDAADWNKVVIIPVTASYTTISSSSILTNVVHDMSLASTRLVGGPNSPNAPIKISVIYSKFK